MARRRRLSSRNQVVVLTAALLVVAGFTILGAGHRPSVAASVPSRPGSHLILASSSLSVSRVRDITLNVDPGRTSFGAFVETWGDNLVFDKNGDRIPDVLLSVHLQRWPIWLGNGAGGFTYDRSLPFSDQHNCVAADFARPEGPRPDGLIDLYCVQGANNGTSDHNPNLLLIQAPGGGFVNPVAPLGAEDPAGRGRAVSLLYPRGDGRPSLFVGNAAGHDYWSPDRIFVNAGKRFIDRHTGGLPSTQNTYCSSTGDFNHDGRQDFLSCSYVLRLYRNLTTPGQPVTYQEIAAQEGIPRSYWTHAELVDLNQDRWPDLVTINTHGLAIRLNRHRIPHFPTVDYRLPLTAGFSFCTGRANSDPVPDLLVVQGLIRVTDKVQRPDWMLLNSGSGRAFTVLPVPQPPLRRHKNGNGDSCAAIPNYQGTRAAWTINNGRPTYPPAIYHDGYRQLVILGR